VAVETLVGRSREAILGRDVRALLPQGTTRLHEQADRDILCDGGSLQYEAQVATHEGRVRDLLISKALVRDDEGRVAGLTAALQDTDRKAAERSCGAAWGAGAARRQPRRGPGPSRVSGDDEPRIRTPPRGAQLVRTRRVRSMVTSAAGPMTARPAGRCWT
jgi:PAS domain S-box-containing protein